MLSYKNKYILTSIILAGVFFSLFGSDAAAAKDEPRLFLRISAEGLAPSNIQWFEELNRTYFQEASEWVSPEASADAAEPEFSRFLPGLSAELDLAVAPRIMLGVGFGWMSRDWNPEWSFSDDSKKSFNGPYEWNLSESISTGVYSFYFQPKYTFIRRGPLSGSLSAAIQYNFMTLKNNSESYSSSLHPDGRRRDSVWESNYEKVRKNLFGYSFGLEGEYRLSRGLALLLGIYYRDLRGGTFFADTRKDRSWSFIEGELIAEETWTRTDQPVNEAGAFNLSGPVLRAGLKIRLF